jgi:hypothetical protein
MEEQSLGKRTAAAHAGTSSTDLLRLWQGDLLEPLLALLPLNAIATVPAVSRRFRDQQWRTYSLIARQTGTICSTTSALLDAVRWTGRDERWSRFDGSIDHSGPPEMWDVTYRPEEQGTVTHTTAIYDKGKDTPSRNPGLWPWHCLQIQTEDPPNGRGGYHGGGLVKRFDSDEFLCIRRVTYSFSFEDVNEEVSHQHPGEHGFAAMTLGPAEEAFAGLLVEPSGRHMDGDEEETWYDLQWWAQDRSHEEASPIMSVTPGSIYSVEIRFDWTVRDSYGLADVTVRSETETGSARHYGRRTFWFERCPLTAINLYNFSASNSEFSSVDVRYSKRTPEDCYAPEIVPAEEE